jgi:hypothetical protein
MHSIHNEQSTKENSRADPKEDAQQNRHGPFISKVAGNLDLEGIVRMVRDQMASTVNALNDCCHCAS